MVLIGKSNSLKETENKSSQEKDKCGNSFQAFKARFKNTNQTKERYQSSHKISR